MIRQIDSIKFPNDWINTKISAIGKVFKGKGISKSEVIESGLPCVRYGEIYTIYNYKVSETKSFVNEESASLSQAIEYGDVLFAGSGESAEEIGKVVTYIGNDTAYAGGDIVIFRPNEPQSGLFFGYYLNSSFINQQKSQSGQGHSVVHLYGKNVENIDVVIPNLKEQQKIAAILSKWDETIEAQTQLIAAKDTQKKALMQKLLTGELRFPGFEEEWEEVTLGDIGESYTGLTGKDKSDFGFGKPYVTYMNIFSNSKLNTNEFLLVNIHENEKQNRVKYGDIFFTTSSETPTEVGMSSVLLDKSIEELYLNSFCFGFRLFNFNILLPEFARFYLRGQELREELNKLAQGATRYNLSKTQLIKAKLRLPKIAEQQKIASVLSSMDLEIEALKNELEALLLQKKGLMQELLTGKIRVKI